MDASSSSGSERRPLRNRIAQHMTRRKNGANNNNNNNINTNNNDSNYDDITVSNVSNGSHNALGSSAMGGSAGAGSSSSTPSPSSASGSASQMPGSSTVPSPSRSVGADGSSLDSTFECNVCFDVPRDPVVTPCGHLYCWPCLYRWTKLHADSPQCPVCKAGVEKESVIPIYGRGRTQADDPRQRPLSDDDAVPPRPAGHRPTPLRAVGGGAGGVHTNFHHPFGRYTTFGGENGIPGNYDFSLPNFGIFPSFLQLNEPPREELRENQDEGIPEVGKFAFSSFFTIYRPLNQDKVKCSNRCILFSCKNLPLVGSNHHCNYHHLLIGLKLNGLDHSAFFIGFQFVLKVISNKIGSTQRVVKDSFQMLKRPQ